MLEKLEENRLLPRVSRKAEMGRRTNVNIHRIIGIVWENGAGTILERSGRKIRCRCGLEVVDGIAVYVIVLLFRKDENLSIIIKRN